MAPLLVVALVLLAPVLWDVLRRPTFRRLALRNVWRRKGEALLVVLGALLGTAIITASFVVGDTIDGSLRDLARTRLGPIDESVRIQAADAAPEVLEALTAQPIPGTDGVLEHLSSGAAVASTGDDPVAEPYVGLTEVDFDAARAFGSDPGLTGMVDAGATPTADEAVLNDRLADALGVGEGDRILVFAYGQERELTVRQVLPEVGLAGYGTVETLGFGPADASPVFVAPGTIESLVDGAEDTAGIAPPRTEVLVSNDGGVFDAAEATGPVTDELRSRVSGLGAIEVVPLKQDLLDDAEASGDAIQELYTGIGSFSVIAGVLLLVNLFVMLAEERKRELGMLRAVGLKRSHLTRTFAIEGAIYAVVAAGAGAVAGIGVGWVITQVASRIFSADDPDFVFRLAVEPSSLATGAVIGSVIALVTVWATSLRISRLNIISAIRDLPEPRHRSHQLRSWVLGALGVVLGNLVLVNAVGSDNPYGIVAGFALAAFSSVPLLTWAMTRKWAIVFAGFSAIAWAVASFNLFPDAMQGADIPVFVIIGVVLVGSAVAITSQIDRFWVVLAEWLSAAGRGLSARLGLAYPLARKFRTGMLLGMYAIVLFTMTFMSTFTGIFSNQAPTFTYELSAGYDLYVDSNPSNPVTTEELEAEPEAAAVAALTRGVGEFRLDLPDKPFDSGPWPLTGFDERLLDERAPVLGARAAGYATDEDVFRAVLEDPSLIILDDFFLQDGGGPPQQRADVGDVVSVEAPATGETRELQVVGIQNSDFIFNGTYVSSAFLSEFLGPRAVESRHYVRLDEASTEEGTAVADALAARYLDRGVDANSFRDEIEGELQETQSFFTLMRGYLALGLVIGIAGLGVVMVRAVRERRREIGMLRAMGFPAKVVRRAFLLEAAFVALQGSVLGIALGLLTSYMVLVNSSTFGDQQLPFEIPWFAVGVILVGPLLASLLATAVPAAQAARIQPAAALRIAE